MPHGLRIRKYFPIGWLCVIGQYPIGQFVGKIESDFRLPQVTRNTFSVNFIRFFVRL